MSSGDAVPGDARRRTRSCANVHVKPRGLVNGLCLTIQKREDRRVRRRSRVDGIRTRRTVCPAQAHLHEAASRPPLVGAGVASGARDRPAETQLARQGDGLFAGTHGSTSRHMSAEGRLGSAGPGAERLARPHPLPSWPAVLHLHRASLCGSERRPGRPGSAISPSPEKHTWPRHGAVGATSRGSEGQV